MTRLDQLDFDGLKTDIHLLTNDITVGWDINQITTEEVSALFVKISIKLLKHELEIPIKLIESWIYILHFPLETKGIKSIKYFGRALQLSNHDRILAVQQLFLQLQIIVREAPKNTGHLVQHLFIYLLNLSKCKEDILIILDAYIESNITQNAQFWISVIAELSKYQNTNIELISLLLHRMIFQYELEIPISIKPILKSFMIQDMKNRHSHGSKFAENLTEDRQSTHDFILGIINSTLVLFVKSKHFNHAIDLFNRFYQIHDIRLSPNILGYAIMQLFRAGKTKETFRLMHQILPPGIVSMPVFIRDSLPVKISGRNVVLNQSLYTSIIAGLISQSFLNDAVKLFEVAESRGFKQSPKMCNSILQGFFTSKPPNFEQGMKCIRFLRKKDTPFSPLTYSTIMHTLCKFRRQSDAQAILDDMMASDVILTLPIYTLIIRTHLRIQGPTTILEILTFMLKKGVKPDAKFFATWINVLINEQLLNHACNVFHFSKEHIIPTQYMFSIIIKGFVQIEDMGMVDKWYNLMISGGNHPSCITYTNIMHGWIKKNDIQNAMKWYGRMIGYDFETKAPIYVAAESMADSRAITQFLSYLENIKDYERLSVVFQITIAMGFAIKIVTKIKFISILFQNGYIWPLVLIPQLKSHGEFCDNEQKYFEMAMNSIDRMKNLQVEGSDCLEIMRKLKIMIEKGDCTSQLHIQWNCLKLQDQVFELFPAASRQFAMYLLSILLLQIVRVQIDQLDLPGLQTSSSINMFVESILKGSVISKIEDLALHKPVCPIYRPKFQKLYDPMIMNMRKYTKNESTNQELSLQNNIETVSTIATSMFPVLANCVGLYRDIKDDFINKPKIAKSLCEYDIDLIANEPIFRIPRQDPNPIVVHDHQYISEDKDTQARDENHTSIDQGFQTIPISSAQVSEHAQLAIDSYMFENKRLPVLADNATIKCPER